MQDDVHETTASATSRLQSRYPIRTYENTTHQRLSSYWFEFKLVRQSMTAFQSSNLNSLTFYAISKVGERGPFFLRSYLGCPFPVGTSNFFSSSFPPSFFSLSFTLSHSSAVYFSYLDAIVCWKWKKNVGFPCQPFFSLSVFFFIWKGRSSGRGLPSFSSTHFFVHSSRERPCQSVSSEESRKMFQGPSEKAEERSHLYFVAYT